MDRSSSTEKFIPMTTVSSGHGIEIGSDIYCFTIQFVNICFVGSSENGWVLIDAGTPKSAQKIINEAKNRFGEDANPKAIILTHAHFDHIGAIFELLEEWDVPVYAHTLELPYLTGKKNYPIPDTTVDAGLIAKLSPMFPTEAIDLGSKVKALPSSSKTVPYMEGWQWIHTPGHTEGHISLFRDKDRALIAGDAFVTVKQESLYSVLTQNLEIHGPPKYLTPDWDSSWESVKLLEKLKPTLAVTGHGHPVSGEWLRENLSMLSRDFDKIAVPKQGKYVNK